MSPYPHPLTSPSPQHMPPPPLLSVSICHAHMHWYRSFGWSLNCPQPPTLSSSLSPAFFVRFDGLLDAFMSLDLSLLISFCCPLYCTNEWDHVKLKVLNSHTSFFFLVFYQTPHFEWSCWWPDKDYRYKKGLIIFIIFLLPKKWNSNLDVAFPHSLSI